MQVLIRGHLHAQQWAALDYFSRYAIILMTNISVLRIDLDGVDLMRISRGAIRLMTWISVVKAHL